MDVTAYPHATDPGVQMVAPVVQLLEAMWDDLMGKAEVVLTVLSERPPTSALNQEV